ncbi:MAG: hypothetical protein ABL934_02715 [Lysobacteraceae bacterium]
MRAPDFVFYAIFLGGIVCLSYFIMGRTGGLPGTARYREKKGEHLEKVCQGLNAASLKRRWVHRVALYWACLFIAFFALNFVILTPDRLYSGGMSDSVKAFVFLAYPTPLAILLYVGAVKIFKWRWRQSQR